MLRRTFVGCLLIIAAILTSHASAQPTPISNENSSLLIGNDKKPSLEQSLRHPISLNFRDVPLKDAIWAIAVQSGVPIVPDKVALKEARVNMEAPVTGSVDNVSLRNALNTIFAPLRLTWIIEDGAIKITPEFRTGSGRLTRRTYRIRDLVTPPPVVVTGVAPKSIECDLMALIRNTVAKESWQERGGASTIAYDADRKALVVSQYQDAHEEIELLLATLRKLQDLMVHVEIRFLHSKADLSNQFSQFKACEETQQEFRNQPVWNPIDRPVTEGKKGSTRFVVMEDENVRRFLTTDKGSSVVSPNAINFNNGQRIAMTCLQKQIDMTELRLPKKELVYLGLQNLKEIRTEEVVQSTTERIKGTWRYDVQPIVSPDRRQVRLNLKVEHVVKDESVERATKSSATFNVGSQRTLVWYLGNSGGQHLYVLVRPRIIELERVEDEERIFLGNMQPIPGR